MRVLALVPARGGSKRLPGKNIRSFAGRPLISWTILAALGVDGISDVLVSTDDPEIRATAQQAGALVPWLRPPYLATDHSSPIDVAVHALDWYESKYGVVDGLMLLQPTSPLRKRNIVELALAVFAEQQRAIASVVSAPVSPEWCMKIVDGILVPCIKSNGLARRSQDLEKVYVPNGSIYLIPPGILRSHLSFFPPDTVPLVMSTEESVDIDTELDFQYAEWLFARAAGVV